MTIEIPVFKKCCFCLPLRPGLLAWAYFKVIAALIIIPFFGFFLLSNIAMGLYAGNKKYTIWILFYAALGLVTFLLFVTDLIATIVFLVGGHKKNVGLIRGYYTYNIGVLIVTALLILVAVCIEIVAWRTIYLLFFAAYLLILVAQAYFIVLLRSEVIKLESHGEVKFVNNSPEAECIITSKDREAAMQDV